MFFLHFLYGNQIALLSDSRVSAQPHSQNPDITCPNFDVQSVDAVNRQTQVEFYARFCQDIQNVKLYL